MKRYVKACSGLPTLGARGLTLVEVVAALALLGTLLSAMLLARGRYVRQNMRAQESVEAVAVTDALLEQWFNQQPVDVDELGPKEMTMFATNSSAEAEGDAEPSGSEISGGDGMPLDQEGEIDGRPGWLWRTQVVDDEPVEVLNARMVRVSIHRARPGEARHEELLTVDVLVSIPEAEDEDEDKARVGGVWTR